MSPLGSQILLFSFRFRIEDSSRFRFLLFSSLFRNRGPFSIPVCSIFLLVSESRPLLDSNLLYFLSCFRIEAPSRFQFALFSSLFRNRGPFSIPICSIFFLVSESRPLLDSNSLYFLSCFGIENHTRFQS